MKRLFYLFFERKWDEDGRRGELIKLDRGNVAKEVVETFLATCEARIERQ